MSERVRVAMTLEQCWHRVPGGTAVAALGMAGALKARSDIDVVGVAAHHATPPPPEWQPPVSVEHLMLPRWLLYEAWHYLRAPRVQRGTGEVSVIHSTSMAVPPKSAPLIVTIHDLAFVHEPRNFTRRGLRFFTRGMELARRDADLILCPSQATARDCIGHGFEEARIRHVPLGIDPPSSDPSEVDRTRRDFGLERPFVFWSGTVEPRKNLPRLLNAFAQVDRDVDLVLAGPRGWHEDLDSLVGPGKTRIKQLGFVTKAQLHALYAAAEVFCWPSLLEGFGFPVLEAMSHGTPVITSRGTSTEEIGGDAALLVDPRDPGAIAAAIERVLGDEALARELSEKSRRRAALFSWERTADGLVQAYSELA